MPSVDTSSIDGNLNEMFRIASTPMNNRFSSSSREPVATAGSIYIPGSRRMPLIPLKDHKLNIDPTPTIIRKKPAEKLSYIQNVSLKFLRPPHPQKAGDINIIQEPDIQAPPPPPLHITQKPADPEEHPPITIRERPPKPPLLIPPKNIIIPGKILPPAPRKVIIERLPQLPPKPQNLIIERWLGYTRRTRNVQFKPAPPIKPAPPPKNILIQWDSPSVSVSQKFNYLGVQIVDPKLYELKYGQSLCDASELPKEANHFKTPPGQVLAVKSNSNETPELIGDVLALKYIDLKCNGLNEYATQL